MDLSSSGPVWASPVARFLTLLLEMTIMTDQRPIGTTISSSKTWTQLHEIRRSGLFDRLNAITRSKKQPEYELTGDPSSMCARLALAARS
jgi:hypothetical protein